MKLIPTLFACLLLPGSLLAATQTIIPNLTDTASEALSNNTINPGQTFKLTLSYHSDDMELGGLGIKLFFDSTKIKLINVDAIYKSGILSPNNDVDDDVKNEDLDPITDSLFNAGWFSIDGKWPGADKASIDLYTLTFTVEDFTGSTNINFVGTAAANSTVNAKSFSITSNKSVQGDSGTTNPDTTNKSSGSLSLVTLFTLSLLMLSSTLFRRYKR